MQSTAPDVTAYLAQAPNERRDCLAALRQLCIDSLSGYEESMQYGMPSYTKDGVVEVAFASQKNYISLYILKQAVIDAHRDALGGASVGKGCIRYRKPAQIDLAIVARLLADTRMSPSNPP